MYQREKKNLYAFLFHSSLLIEDIFPNSGDTMNYKLIPKMFYYKNENSDF